jgi:hypothetical protein
MSDVLDYALSKLTCAGPEYGPGFANHGPMAAEALVAMGREDAVERWAEDYAPRLSDAPESRNAITGDDWREALGDIKRVGDWSAFFTRELEAQPFATVLDTWVARLAPGIMAGALHGLLRTAHAVRALDRGETRERRRELAEGLAYWAARYQTLPSAPAMRGNRSVIDALRAVPLVAPANRQGFMITQRARTVETTDFAPVINTVAVDGDPGAFVSDVARVFVRQYTANADAAAIAFVHTVTGPSALRSLVPHLSPATAQDAMRYAWQACAAIYAANGDAPIAPAPPGVPITDHAGLIDQAVEARDEHAIKFTEACLREYAHTPDAAFLAAAQDAVVRLRMR